MAVAVRLSELTAITPAQISDSDLLLITDSESTSSKKLTLLDFKDHLFSGNSFGSFSDVDLSAGALDGQFLRYNGTTQRWNAGDISLSSIGTLTDVDLVTTPPQDGQTLIWDGTLNRFYPGSNLGALYTLLGEGAGDTDLGVFAGSIDLDNINVRTAIQRLSNAITSTATTAAAATDDVDQDLTALTTRVTTAETTLSNLDIDIAPETLNSINELATALGDDPAFLTTLQTRDTQIEGQITSLAASLATEQGTQDSRLADLESQIALMTQKIISIDERVDVVDGLPSLVLSLEENTPSFAASSDPIFTDSIADGSTTTFVVTLDAERGVYALEGVPQPTVQVPRGDIIVFDVSGLPIPAHFRIYDGSTELSTGVVYDTGSVTLRTSQIPVNLSRINYRNSLTPGLGWIIEVVN